MPKNFCNCYNYNKCMQQSDVMLYTILYVRTILQYTFTCWKLVPFRLSLCGMMIPAFYYSSPYCMDQDGDYWHPSYPGPGNICNDPWTCRPSTPVKVAASSLFTRYQFIIRQLPGHYSPGATSLFMRCHSDFIIRLLHCHVRYIQASDWNRKIPNQ